MKFLGTLFLGLCFLIYALYCHQNGGSHHKGRGWVTKEEAPKTLLELKMKFLADKKAHPDKLAEIKAKYQADKKLF